MKAELPLKKDLLNIMCVAKIKWRQSNLLNAFDCNASPDF
jgi:hypothetical protein